MTSPLGRLLLLRLAISDPGKPPKPATVQKDLAGVLADQTTEPALTAARGELIAAGLTEVYVPPPKPSTAKKPPKKPPAPKIDPAVIQATAAGRSAAAKLLNVDAIPPLTWPKLQSQFLLPLAMGLPPGSKAPTAAKLVPTLVANKLGLKPGLTTGKLLDAIAFRELGFPEIATWPELRTAALNRLLSQTTGQPVNLAGKQLEAQVPLAVLGAPRASPESIKAKALRDWLGAEAGGDAANTAPSSQAPAAAPPSLPSGEVDLADFARRALAAARAVAPAGWFGHNKVFINHAWRRFGADSGAPGVDIDGFKKKLIEAHQADLLTLSRADLVAAMNADDVAESEARYLNAQFHFILMEGERI